MRKVLWLIADRPQRLVDKGELTPRYYNSGDFFDEVHLVACNGQIPQARDFQVTAGRAAFFGYRLWKGPHSLGCLRMPLRYRQWGDAVVELAQKIKPDLVRAADRITGYLAWRIWLTTGIPYILSLHCHREEEVKRIPWWSPVRWLRVWEATLIDKPFGNAAYVLPVYQSIVPYARKHGARRIEVMPNAVAMWPHHTKTDYRITVEPRLIWVDRLCPVKDPRPVLKALNQTPGILWVYGDGEYAVQHNSSRVHVCGFQPNKGIIEKLHTYDMMVSNNQTSGISKGMMEAMLVGLPIVGWDHGFMLPGLIMPHDGRPDSIAQGIRKLAQDPQLACKIARKAWRYANQHWNPVEIEQRWADIFNQVLTS